MSKQAIQALAGELKIPYLLHFTRAANVPSIMAHGLYPIGRTHEIGAVPAINDQLRLDGHKNGTSVSIGFPNCQMLYKYRMDEQNKTVDWAVLLVHPAALWTKDCAFCRHNAADARISNLSLHMLKTLQAFAGMFEEIPGQMTREEQRLKPSDPTDVQAEVLVLDILEPKYICGAIFEKASVRDALLPHLGEWKTYIHANNKGMFANRKYARTWGN